MQWQNWFKLVKLVPGRVIVQGYGEIDFSKEVNADLCLDICENTTGLLEITTEGMEKFYGISIKN
jgi:hypothetical protein